MKKLARWIPLPLLVLAVLTLIGPQTAEAAFGRRIARRAYYAAPRAVYAAPARVYAAPVPAYAAPVRVYAPAVGVYAPAVGVHVGPGVHIAAPGVRIGVGAPYRAYYGAPYYYGW
jgi:hypothetical protein